jgi:hypothetical protein
MGSGKRPHKKEKRKKKKKKRGNFFLPAKSSQKALKSNRWCRAGGKKRLTCK